MKVSNGIQIVYHNNEAVTRFFCGVHNGLDTKQLD